MLIIYELLVSNGCFRLPFMSTMRRFTLKKETFIITWVHFKDQYTSNWRVYPQIMKNWLCWHNELVFFLPAITFLFGPSAAKRHLLLIVVLFDSKEKNLSY